MQTLLTKESELAKKIGEEVIKYELKLAASVNFELFRYASSPSLIAYQLKKTMSIENGLFQKILNYLNDFYLSKYVIYFSNQQLICAAFMLSFRELKTEIADMNWPGVFGMTLGEAVKVSFLLSQVYKVEMANTEKVNSILKTTFGANFVLNLVSFIGNTAALQIIGLIIR